MCREWSVPPPRRLRDRPGVKRDTVMMRWVPGARPPYLVGEVVLSAEQRLGRDGVEQRALLLEEEQHLAELRHQLHHLWGSSDTCTFCLNQPPTESHLIRYQSFEGMGKLDSDSMWTHARQSPSITASLLECRLPAPSPCESTTASSPATNHTDNHDMDTSAAVYPRKVRLM